MSDLIVIGFPSEAKAEEVRQKLLDMQNDYLIDLEDAVIAVKQPDGRVKLNRLFHPTALGAAYGSLWGLLVGLIFMMPVPGAAVAALPAAGAAIGAAAGAVGGAMADVGVNDQVKKEITDTLQSGNAALFLLIRSVTADKVLEAVKGEGGKVLRTSYDETKDKALRDALAGVGTAQPAQPVQPAQPAKAA